MTDKRCITQCYVVRTLEPYGNGEIVKICSNRKIAEHYRRLLQPKYHKAFDIDLTIDEYPFMYLESELVKIDDKAFVEVLKENKEDVQKSIEFYNEIEKGIADKREDIKTVLLIAKTVPRLSISEHEAIQRLEETVGELFNVD